MLRRFFPLVGFSLLAPWVGTSASAQSTTNPVPAVLPPIRYTTPYSVPVLPVLTTRNYPVADLLGTLTESDPSLGACTGVTHNARPQKNVERQLIKLIESSVCPESWQAQGGAGSVRFDPKSNMLVITQQPATHQQVAELLTSLRKLQELQVRVDTHLFEVSPQTMERLAAGAFVGESRRQEFASHFYHFRGAVVPEADLTSLLLTLQGGSDTTVLSQTRFTLGNAQKGSIRLEGHDTSKIAWRMQPRVSTDRQHTALGLTLKIQDSTSEMVLCVPRGGYCLIAGTFLRAETEPTHPVLGQIPYLERLFRNVAIREVPWVALVRVTPSAPPEEQSELILTATRVSEAVGRFDKQWQLTSEEASSARGTTPVECTCPSWEDRWHASDTAITESGWHWSMGFQMADEDAHQRWTRRWSEQVDSPKRTSIELRIVIPSK